MSKGNPTKGGAGKNTGTEISYRDGKVGREGIKVSQMAIADSYRQKETVF